MRVIQFVLIGVLVVSGPAMAKGDKKKHDMQHDPQQMMETYKQLATPGEPHKQLASLAGSWSTATKEWMAPGAPPTESTGTCEEKMVLDGRFLQQECTGQMMGQPFNGLGMIGYDNFQKKYITTWMSSMGTDIFFMNGTGSPDGKTITLIGGHKDPYEGFMKHRAIWKLVDDNTQTFTMYGSGKQGKEMKMLEITYTRKS